MPFETNVKSRLKPTLDILYGKENKISFLKSLCGHRAWNAHSVRHFRETLMMRVASDFKVKHEAFEHPGSGKMTLFLLVCNDIYLKHLF